MTDELEARKRDRQEVGAAGVVERRRAALAEDLAIARIVRERTAAGPATPLQESAVKLGIDLGSL